MALFCFWYSLSSTLNFPTPYLEDIYKKCIVLSLDSDNQKTIRARLWLMIPRVGYNYHALTLEYKTTDTVVIKLYGLGGQQLKEITVNVNKDKSSLTQTLVKLVSSEQVNHIFEFLVERIDEDLLVEA